MLIFDILSCLFHLYIDKIKSSILYLGNMIKRGKMSLFLMTVRRFINRREYFKWENMRLEINQPTTFTTLGK